jgi:hypothetical protein
MTISGRCAKSNGLPYNTARQGIRTGTTLWQRRRLEMLSILARSFLIAAMVAVTAPLSAQPPQTGTISGVVQDSSAGVMPGVTVTITSQDRGFTRSTVSDANGHFVFPAVPIGP